MVSIINFTNEIFRENGNTITARLADALRAQKVVEAAYIFDKEKKLLRVFNN